MTIMLPINVLEKAFESNRFTIMVIYRGDWCPSSRRLLTGLAALQPRITAAGGGIIAVTSQGAAVAAQTGRTWSLFNRVRMVGDPSNEVVRHLSVFYGFHAEVLVADELCGNYPDGMAQLAVLAINRQRRIIYRWQQIAWHSPAGQNLVPDAPSVWRSVRAALGSDVGLAARVAHVCAALVKHQRLLPAYLDCDEARKLAAWQRTLKISNRDHVSCDDPVVEATMAEVKAAAAVAAARKVARQSTKLLLHL